MSVLRYYARSTGITFTRDQSWYSLGQIKLEQKEAQLVAWEQRANFKKVQELLVRLNLLLAINFYVDFSILLESRSCL